MSSIHEQTESKVSDSKSPATNTNHAAMEVSDQKVLPTADTKADGTNLVDTGESPVDPEDSSGETIHPRDSGTGAIPHSPALDRHQTQSTYPSDSSNIIIRSPTENELEAMLRRDSKDSFEERSLKFTFRPDSRDITEQSQDQLKSLKTLRDIGAWEFETSNSRPGTANSITLTPEATSDMIDFLRGLEMFHLDMLQRNPDDEAARRMVECARTYREVHQRLLDGKNVIFRHKPFSRHHTSASPSESRSRVFTGPGSPADLTAPRPTSNSSIVASESDMESALNLGYDPEHVIESPENVDLPDFPSTVDLQKPSLSIQTQGLRRPSTLWELSPHANSPETSEQVRPPATSRTASLSAPSTRPVTPSPLRQTRNSIDEEEDGIEDLPRDTAGRCRGSSVDSASNDRSEGLRGHSRAGTPSSVRTRSLADIYESAKDIAESRRRANSATNSRTSSPRGRTRRNNSHSRSTSIVPDRTPARWDDLVAASTASVPTGSAAQQSAPSSSCNSVSSGESGSRPGTPFAQKSRKFSRVLDEVASRVRDESPFRQ